MCASIEPSVTTAQLLDKQVAGFHVQSVEIGNLKLATCRRLQVASELNNAVVIKIQAGDRIVRLWLLRFFLDTDRFAAFAELHHAIVLRILNAIGKHRRTAFARDRACQQMSQIGAVENVVAKDQCNIVVANEFTADDECLGKTFRFFLISIGNMRPSSEPLPNKAL